MNALVDSDMDPYGTEMWACRLEHPERNGS